MTMSTRMIGRVNGTAIVAASPPNDGRLFVVEQDGGIRIFDQEQLKTTPFIDISSKIAGGTGSEQGLLGLAFHPLYWQNNYFYVWYTANNPNAANDTHNPYVDVLERYKASATDLNKADPNSGQIILSIPDFATNHNGGMLEFGSDGYLYVGTGDGGGGGDPDRNGQNQNALLGKILRIDVDHPDTAAGTAYSVPADNPFVNAPGRDEIYAYGLRNPFRFSFDRVTGVLWAADVGQDAREEVDMPIVRGGNYGWRVYEGFACTGNDPLLCNPAGYRFPIFDYSHDNGRCSITGGYVYRGNQGAVPGGTYVFGDYCSGEIFAWNGAAQAVLLDTPGNISSFGEDEHGELYVVDLGGTLSKLTPTTPCTYAIAPTDGTFAKAGGAGSIAVTTGVACAWNATSRDAWISLGATISGTGDGTVTYVVAPYTGKPKRRTGTLGVAGSTFTVTQTKLRLLVRHSGG